MSEAPDGEELLMHVTMKKCLVLAFALCLLAPCAVSSSAFAGEDEEARVNFRWAFGAITGPSDNRHFEPVGAESVLKTGDQLRMMVELVKPCYVYVIHQDARGELELLFPYSLDQFATDYRVNERYYIPRGDAWFELDERTGREDFYVLASAERLTALEERLRDYDIASGEARQKSAQAVLAEIRNVKRQHRELASSAERPVAIGGAVRGIDKINGGKRPDVASIADPVLSTATVARVIQVAHQ